jgi:hypothetical protein
VWSEVGVDAGSALEPEVREAFRMILEVFAVIRFEAASADGDRVHAEKRSCPVKVQRWTDG